MLRRPLTIEMAVPPGCRAVLKNPKPMTAFRQTELDGRIWRVLPDSYGPEAEMRMRTTDDVEAALRGLEDVARRSGDLVAVYSVQSDQRGSRIGAVLIRLPLPERYVPKAARRPLPQ